MKKLLKNLQSWWIAILVAFLVSVIVRIFIGQTFVIPTQSMENGLLKGDVVWVNKLSYGPRLPITLLTFPFAHKEFSFSPGTKAFLEYIQLPYTRLGKNLNVNYDDVLAFNYPMDDFFPVDHRTYMVKRCIGLPGDVISNMEGILYRNNSMIAFPASVKRNYLLKDTKEDDLKPYLDKELSKEDVQKTTMGLILNLTAEEHLFFKEIFQQQLILYANWQPATKESKNATIWIPKSGESFEINAHNLDLYRYVMENEEGCEILKFPSGKFKLNNSEALESHTYQFKHNYYYVVGDNYDNSADSRNWGLLPESHILGKVTTIFYSVQSNGSFRWDRTLKNI